MCSPRVYEWINRAEAIVFAPSATLLKLVSKYFWLSFVPFTLLALVAIGLMVFGVISWTYLTCTFVCWILIDGLGVAVGYHRVFSHRCLPHLPKWKENILLFLGTLSGQGSSVVWVAVHRGYHHAHADNAKDLHSPVHGLWHAFAGWTYGLTETNRKVNVKYAIDLLRKPNHRWFHEHNWKILWLVPSLIALVDWKAFMALCLAIGWSLWSENFINIMGHTKLPGSYRNFETPDRSMNHWLACLTWGHGWHNNHHAKPDRFSFKERWWEWDPVCLFLPFLGKANEPKRSDDQRSGPSSDV